MSCLRDMKGVVAMGVTCLGAVVAADGATVVDRQLAADNQAWEDGRIILGQPLGDLGYLRKATIDVIGRIPTFPEIEQYQKVAQGQAPGAVAGSLVQGQRAGGSVDYFHADLLRIRSRAEGATACLRMFINP